MLLKGISRKIPCSSVSMSCNSFIVFSYCTYPAGALQVERTCRIILSATGQDNSLLHSPICAGNTESEVAGVGRAALERLQKAGLKRMHLQALLDNLKPLAASGEQLQAGKRIRGPAILFHLESGFSCPPHA